MYLALTGSRLKGADVYQAGIATHYINSARLEQLEAELQSLELVTKDGTNLSSTTSASKIGAILDGCAHEYLFQKTVSLNSPQYSHLLYNYYYYYFRYHEASAGAEGEGGVETWSLAPHIPLIEKSFTGESVESIVASLESFETGSDAGEDAATNEASKAFAAKQLKALSRVSPTSLKVTFEQVRFAYTLGVAREVGKEGRRREGKGERERERERERES